MAKAYRYSVLRRYEGHAERDEVVKRTALVELESDDPPKAMKGKVLCEVPEDGAYQIRTDGPDGSGFADWQHYGKGAVIVHPGV